MPTPTTNSGLRDNRGRGSVADFLRAELRPGAELDLVTAYFTIFAHDRLRAELGALGHVRLLFGEAAFIKTIDPSKQDGAAFVLRDDGLALATGLRQRPIAEACAAWLREKVEIRSVLRDGFLHGKMSCIRRGEVSAAIVGSSNFTTRGLGLAAAGSNVELNLVVSDDRDRAELRAWFEELWNDRARVEDVKQRVLDYLLQVYADQSPEFVYFKTLFEIFKNQLRGDAELDQALTQSSLLETNIWKALYDFQKDGAKAAINKLKNFNGCILADSVGLGKTYEALAAIKFFELKNERVLVLCPKKLADNWLIYRQNSALNPFERDRFRFDVLHHTDLSRDRGTSNGTDLATLNWGNYDLVVIDESHNFRNNSAGPVDEHGEKIRRTRYERLIEDIIGKGIRTKVLLLSATPVNNELADLRNQISFIAGGDVARDAKADAAFAPKLEIKSVAGTTRAAQTRFTQWANLPPTQRDKKDLISVLGGDFLKLLDALTIARSRRHVAKHYEAEMQKLGGFPRRVPPESLHPDIDAEGKFPSYDAVAAQLAEYKLWIFQPSSFLRDGLTKEIRDGYERRVGGFDQKGRERILTCMMRVTLLKRLESSIDSFRISLGNTLAKITRLEGRMARFEQFRAENPDLDYDTLSPDELDDPDLADAIQVGRRVVFKMAHLDLDKWRARLAEDRAQLTSLLDLATPITAARDAKLAELKARIAAKAAQPTADKDGAPNKKVLVFTAYADTAHYLYRELHAWARTLGIHASLVVGSGDNASTLTATRNFTDILLDFSPRSKRRAEIRGGAETAQVDLLIATDCISEGQNLQDCDTVINYDIHWNPVRIIQRFGRIDRIGSKAAAVHLVNFWPTEHLDRYIKLKARVEARMALVDVTATQTDNPLDEQQIEDLITADLRMRDQQLVRLKAEVFDLEDAGDAVTLADFTLDEFRMDLARFLEANREKLERAPDGLYAVVPPAAHIPAAQPGVIFCLRHYVGQTFLSAAEKQTGMSAPPSEKLNPLAPHYLVFVHADGTVRFTFTQAKTILNLFRELALGKSEAYDDLCRLFDRQTERGTDVARYDPMMRAAVDSIAATFQKKLAAGLQDSRDFLLPPAVGQVTPSSEFELVTWLVLLPQ